MPKKIGGHFASDSMALNMRRGIHVFKVVLGFWTSVTHIKGFYVMSYQAKFARHRYHPSNHHIDFFFARPGSDFIFRNTDLYRNIIIRGNVHFYRRLNSYLIVAIYCVYAIYSVMVICNKQTDICKSLW